MRHYTYFLFLVSSLILNALLFSRCTKEKLPKATQEGKNTFGCKVNGKNWVPQGGGPFSGLEPVNGGYQATYNFNITKNNVFIRAYNGESSINIYLRSVERTGVYPLNFDTGSSPNYRNPDNYGYYETEGNINGIIRSIEYYTTTQYTGRVNITRADTTNKIISGTFEFTAVNRETGKTVKVTDGRFDVKNH